MVVPPSSGGAGATSSTNRPTPIANNASSSKPKSAGQTPSAPVSNAPVPLSARRSDPLDLSTVERRGQPNAAPEITKRNRLHSIPEGPTFRPTEEEFRDPMEYMRKIAPEGAKYGIAKIIPPDGWNMDFAIDTTVCLALIHVCKLSINFLVAVPFPCSTTGTQFCGRR